MTIALNILYVPYNTETICRTYRSKYNNKRENQVILLMISDNKKWHYLALKSQHIFYGEKWCNQPKKNYLNYLR